MKKGFLFRKSLLAFSMMFSLGTISSCSAFFGGDDFAITDTTIEQNENGDTIVTITFSGDNIEPLTFTIPKVQNGIDGNGIASITPVLTEEGSIELTIKYTDTTMEDTVITIPVIKGDTGVGINDVLIGSDEDGNTTIQFTYTNGTTSDLITIPKGIDGENGIGIANIDVQKTSTGLNIVTITFTDENMAPVSFTVNDGVSIASIVYDEENSTDEIYSLFITFSDGTFTSVELPRPQSTLWLSGTTNPDSSSGKIGDFYLNIVTGDVYRKISDTSWEFLFSMKGSGSSEQIVRHQVRFNLRDDEYTSTLPGGSVSAFNVEDGKTIPLDSIPTPMKDGYDFVGWFAGEDETNPNVGQFTNLTVVSEDLDLYARWLEK